MVLADEVLLINVCCGVAAGVISSCIANPTDVLKVRGQGYSQFSSDKMATRKVIE